MDEITNKTEIRDTKPERNTARRIVGVVFGAIEVLLAIRFFFKLLGANPDNGFVHGIYVATQIFVRFFEGIFPKATASGSGITAVFEPAVLITMGLIALIGWIVLKLMTPRIGTRVEETTKTGFVKIDDQDERKE